MIVIFGGGMLLLWPVLLPINAVNQKGEAGGVSGLDLLSISNVQDTWRYWIHTVAAILFIGIKGFQTC
jgi:calcium permeable stress-gated cation channel